MYVSIHPAVSKSPKLPNCLKRAEASVVLIIFNGTMYSKSHPCLY
jgi:hypothetical protein